jgi:hypothetical protein
VHVNAQINIFIRRQQSRRRYPDERPTNPEASQIKYERTGVMQRSPLLRGRTPDYARIQHRRATEVWYVCLLSAIRKTSGWGRYRLTWSSKMTLILASVHGSNQGRLDRGLTVNLSKSFQIA